MKRIKTNTLESNHNVDASLENNMQFLSPYFLGAYGENNDNLEKLLIEFVRDHIYWRRNYHPEDKPPITPQMINSQSYVDSMAKIRGELHALTAKLKRSVPFYNPRYIGHMASDLMMPGLLAQLITCFYNPNNITGESGPVTLKMDLEVGQQFARMFGFNTDPSKSPCAWGHLTSGGTNANYESLWNFRAAKYYPIAIQNALKKLNLEIDLSEQSDDYKNIKDYSLWELVNLSIDQVIEVMGAIPLLIKSKYGQKQLNDYKTEVEKHRIEYLGQALFFAENWQIKPPVVLVPATAHYSWEKAMRVLGFGASSLIKVPLNSAMRMDEDELKRILGNLKSQNVPVLAVIGVLGTTEYGTIDPIDSIVELRKESTKDGLNYYIHVDAAWGGYLTSLFRDEDDELLPIEKIKQHLDYFPSPKIYNCFKALSDVDSITIDPHKQGYLPFGTGGFIARNRDIVRLLSTDADYVFSQTEEPDFMQIGQYILEGSKPGANAAAVHVAHAVLPLNSEHFGRVIRQTIRSAEYFFSQLKVLKKNLQGKVCLTVPFEPDSNLVTIAINPDGNQDLALMNQFASKVYEKLTHDSDAPIQTREFLGSKTQLKIANLTKDEQTELFKKLHLFDKSVSTERGDKVFILRHTLMNPWLSSENDGLNYVDKYCQYLETILKEIVKDFNAN
jgi:glutamate/tyrosine decarboxylase-like PLP-dependent enzyme